MIKPWLNLILLIQFALVTMLAHAQETITDPESGVTYIVERYTVANYPVALAFAPDGRLFYTEKNTGNVRVIRPDGEVHPEPVLNLPTSALAERGMLGIALDPDYETNGHIWLMHVREATPRDYAALNLVRFVEESGLGHDPEVMFSIPLENKALIHMGGNIGFDSSGDLYISVGNMEIAAHAQNLDTPQGAIHRFAVTDDGLVPAESNPFADSSIYAYGLRNPYDFAIDPLSDSTRIFAVENGDQCDDEVNVVFAQFNYGAGENYTCGGVADGTDMAFYMPPLVAYTPTIAPTGIVVYDHEGIPEWHGNVFYCAWNTGTIYRMILNEQRTQAKAIYELPIGAAAQCRIDITIGPEGGLYFSTVGEEGGAIYRLLPAS